MDTSDLAWYESAWDIKFIFEIWRTVMRARIFLDVDPAQLRLPPSRRDGADPGKLQQQISRHGISTVNMPPIDVYRGLGNELMIFNGVTRATRVAKLLPGNTVRVEVLRDIPVSFSQLPKVGEKLP